VTDEFPVPRDVLYDYLKTQSIWARRYFYPLISEFPMYRNLPSANSQNLPHALQTSREIICLPQHAELDMKTVHYIVDCIRKLADSAQSFSLAA
jgi:dTDP-4-amino-4,6-dideoxygalactose transaminase